jgi:hypothetical protein
MNMNLKGIMQTLGAKPGQVMSDPYARAWAPTPSPIKEAEGEDHEVSMAQNSLDTIIKMATELKDKMGENEKDIPAWIQDHITNAENFISQASSNYHEDSTNEAGINGAPRFPSLDGVANESISEEVKDWDTIHNVFVKFLKANTKELEKRVLSKDEDATKKAIKSIVSGLTNAQRSLKMESIKEGFEVHYSDGIRAAKKFGNEKQAVDFAKDLIKSKKGLQFVDVFNAGSGFNSTADTNAIVAWWGKGSYTDNKSKNDSKLAAKKIKESLRLTNLK